MIKTITNENAPIAVNCDATGFVEFPGRAALDKSDKVVCAVRVFAGGADGSHAPTVGIPQNLDAMVASDYNVTGAVQGYASGEIAVVDDAAQEPAADVLQNYNAIGSARAHDKVAIRIKRHIATAG